MKQYCSQLVGGLLPDVFADFLIELRPGFPRPIFDKFARHSIASTGNKKDFVTTGGVEVDMDERFCIKLHRLFLLQTLAEHVCIPGR